MKALTLARLKPVALAALLIFAAPVAMAEDAKCTDAKMLIGLISKLSNLPPDITDKLILDMALRVSKEDGSPMTERMFYKSPDGDMEIVLERDEAGMLTNTEVLANLDEDGELCRQAEDGSTPDAKSQTDMNMQFIYLDSSGAHSTADLFEGLGDGTAQMKTLAPGPVKLLVPKLRYYIVTPTEGKGKAPPNIQLAFYKGGEPVEFQTQYFQGMKVLGQSELKKAKIDRVEISGDAYKLMAMPKPDKDELSDTPQELMFDDENSDNSEPAQ